MAFGGSGFTVWLTGLPGSGKSTLATALAETCRFRGQPAEVLDGDALRATMSRDLGFSRVDRETQVRRIGVLAVNLSNQGTAAIVAAVSPYRDARREVRQRHAAPFVEVFVTCALPTLVQRDPKGLYARALAGEIPNFTGISDPYEAPEAAEITVHTDRQSADASLAALVAVLERRRLIATLT
jgi:adenylylsulfate kinase